MALGAAAETASLKKRLLRHGAHWLLPFILIVCVAFGYRLVIMAERAAAPNEISGWDPLPEGTDQRTYYTQLHDLFAGNFPSGAFYYQPGITYLFGAVALLVQSADLLSMRLALALLASLNCALLAMITSKATGRWRAGWLAGLMLALYPVNAFHDTELMITGMAVILATAMLGCAWLATSDPCRNLPPLLTGLLAGVITVTRFQLIAPGIVCAVLPLINGAGKGRRLFLAVIAALLFTMPVILHNHAAGAQHLFVPIGPRVFYYGNARDAQGIASPSGAAEATGLDEFHYFLQDLTLEPLRFAELWLHKAGLFMSSIVTGQNLDYQKAKDNFSLALALNPLSFSALLVPGLAGWLLLWKRSETRAFALLLILCFFSYMLAVMTTYVETRFSTPVVIYLLPAAAYAVDQFIAALRGGARLAVLLRRGWKTALALVCLLLAIEFAAHELPRDVTVTDLPADAWRAGLIYDEALELVGWKVRERYSPMHTIEPYHPWVVSLYWRLLRPAKIDYSFSLKYFIGDEAFIEYDRPLGYTVFPRDRTSQWRTNAIYVEHIGITWEGYSGPFERTGQVTLDVYPEREAGTRLRPQDANGAQVNRPDLARPAILLAPGRNELPTDIKISFGNQLFLLGYALPKSARAGQTLLVETSWKSGQEQIRSTYSIGVYAFLEGDFLANADGSPNDGRLESFSLLPNYRFDDKKRLVLPPAKGVYDIFVGVYDIDSGIRLPTEAGQDNLVHIGRVNAQ